MSEPTVTLTDEQWQAYMLAAEDLIESRRQAGTLLSSFDVLAGASLLYFHTNNSTHFPARWAFAGLRPGSLPDGVMELAERLDRQYREAITILDTIDELEEEAKELTKSTQQLTKSTQQLTNTVNKSLDKVRAAMATQRDAPPSHQK